MSVYNRVTECRVTLSIFSRTRTLRDISELLDLLATKEYVKGERVPIHSNGLDTGRISEFNMWCFKIDIDDLRSLEEHFSAVISLMNDKRIEQLAAISKEAEVTLEVYLVNESGIEVSNQMMSVLSKCGATLTIDVQE